MKTSIVAQTGTGTYRRAMVPDDMPGKKDGGYPVLDRQNVRVPSFEAAHVEQFSAVVSISPFKTKKGSRKLPDCVFVGGSNRYHFERGKADLVRIIPEHYALEIDLLDATLNNIAKLRREMIEEAFRHGRPVTAAEVRGWQEMAKVITEAKGLVKEKLRAERDGSAELDIREAEAKTLHRLTREQRPGGRL